MHFAKKWKEFLKKKHTASKTPRVHLLIFAAKTFVSTNRTIWRGNIIFGRRPNTARRIQVRQLIAKGKLANLLYTIDVPNAPEARYFCWKSLFIWRMCIAFLIKSILKQLDLDNETHRHTTNTTYRLYLLSYSRSAGRTTYTQYHNIHLYVGIYKMHAEEVSYYVCRLKIHKGHSSLCAGVVLRVLALHLVPPATNSSSTVWYSTLFLLIIVVDVFFFSFWVDKRGCEAKLFGPQSLIISTNNSKKRIYL